MRNTGKVITGVIALAALAAFVSMLPDVRRYIKIETM